MEDGHGFNYKSFIITFLCGFAGSLIIGFMLYQQQIFSIYENRFIYTSLGFAGAIVFSVMLFRGIKDSVLTICAVYILNLLICKTHNIGLIINFAFIFGSYWLVIYMFNSWLYNSTGRYKEIRSLGLGILSALILIITGLFFLFINFPLEKVSLSIIYMITKFYLINGFLIGLGLGLGFDLAELLITKDILHLHNKML